jgi:hypothetical protein
VGGAAGALLLGAAFFAAARVRAARGKAAAAAAAAVTAAAPAAPDPPGASATFARDNPMRGAHAGRMTDSRFDESDRSASDESDHESVDSGDDGGSAARGLPAAVRGAWSAGAPPRAPFGADGARELSPFAGAPFGADGARALSPRLPAGRLGGGVAADFSPAGRLPADFSAANPLRAATPARGVDRFAAARAHHARARTTPI